MNKQKILEIVRKWKISKKPEYRSFRCAKCQRVIRKAWHVWLENKGFKIEVHFCKKCFKNRNKFFNFYLQRYLFLPDKH